MPDMKPINRVIAEIEQEISEKKSEDKVKNNARQQIALFSEVKGVA